MWELDYKESWGWKNRCFWTVVLKKTLETPLDCKEIEQVHPKGNQSWIFIGRADAEAETPILWPPDAKNWLIGKNHDAGKDWRREEKGTTEDEIVGWYHRLDGHEFEQVLGVGDGQGGPTCCSPWGRKESQTWLRDWTELNWILKLGLPRWLSGKESACQCRRRRFHPWVGKIPEGRKWQPDPVFVLGNPGDRGASWATVHQSAKSQTWLRDYTTTSWDSVPTQHSISTPHLWPLASTSALSDSKNSTILDVLFSCVLSCFTRAPLFATAWTVGRQAPLSLGFSRQDYWNGLPCPPLGDLPNPAIKPASLMPPALAGGFFTTSTTREAQISCISETKQYVFSSAFEVKGGARKYVPFFFFFF